MTPSNVHSFIELNSKFKFLSHENSIAGKTEYENSNFEIFLQLLSKIVSSHLAGTFTSEQFDWLISKLILLSPNQNAWEISYLRNPFTDVCGP